MDPQDVRAVACLVAPTGGHRHAAAAVLLPEKALRRRVADLPDPPADSWQQLELWPDVTFGFRPPFPPGTGLHAAGPWTGLTADELEALSVADSYRRRFRLPQLAT